MTSIQALIRSERYDAAKQEANRGIDILRGLAANDADSRSSDELKKCMQRQDVAQLFLGKKFLCKTLSFCFQLL